MKLELIRQQKREMRKQKRRKKIRKVKEELKADFKLNAPNIITLSRLLLAFFLVYMMFYDYSRLAIAIVFSIAALSDALDGFVARRFNQKSYLGGRLDQVIDRIFTGIVVIALIIYFFANNLLDRHFIIMVFLVSSREIIGFPGIFIRIIRAKDVYEVRYIGKITCWFQGVAIASIIAGFNFSIYLSILAGIIGIYSGFDYLKRSFM